MGFDDICQIELNVGFFIDFGNTLITTQSFKKIELCIDLLYSSNINVE